jgi:hypothetical protein
VAVAFASGERWPAGPGAGVGVGRRHQGLAWHGQSGELLGDWWR